MVNEQILAALKIGAQKSAAFWKPVYNSETRHGQHCGEQTGL